jgi:UDP-N-acetylmuramate dehydrogenase
LARVITEADSAGEDVLVLGSGSHLVVSDRGLSGLLVRDGRKDIAEVDSYVSCGGSTVKATAGTDWDTFVQFTLENDLAGLEALSGIPGTVGAAPVQNLGAFGQEVAQTLASVRALDRLTGRIRTLSRFDLHLGYRSSIIKRSRFSADAGGGQLWGPTGRWVVLEASFQLRSASLSEPVRYRSLAESLGVDLGTRVPSWELREHVLKLRAESGMLLGPQDHDHPDHDTWSAGSFFGNPILSSQDAAKLPEEAPRFPVRNQAMFVSGTVHKQAPLVEGKQKVPAAWLTRQSGFEPGYRVNTDSRAALSSKHVSAITNRGGATATEIMELAAAVHDGVAAKFGISLVPEPVLVGLEGLD